MPGQKSKTIKLFTDAIERGRPVNLQDVGIATCASTLKHYLRVMDPPLLTFTLCDHFASAAGELLVAYSLVACCLLLVACCLLLAAGRLLLAACCLLLGVGGEHLLASKQMLNWVLCYVLAQRSVGRAIGR